MNGALLLAPAPSTGGQGSIFSMLVPMALVIAIFYFLLIAPARRQRKQMQQMLASLKAGDRVLTSGGIYGTIVKVSEQVIRLRVADNVQIDVARSAISGREPEQTA